MTDAENDDAIDSNEERNANYYDPTLVSEAIEAGLIEHVGGKRYRVLVSGSEIPEALRRRMATQPTKTKIVKISGTLPDAK